MSHIASGSHFNASDFLFGDSETDVLGDFQVNGHGNGTGSALRNNRSGGDAVEMDGGDQVMEWVLPSEAFQPRHEIKDRSPPPEHFSSRCFSEPRIRATRNSDIVRHLQFLEL